MVSILLVREHAYSLCVYLFSNSFSQGTGSVFVAACDSTFVSELDPNGLIQNGFELSSNISGWTVGPTTASSFEFDYFANDPFVLRCLQTPSGVEVILGNSSGMLMTTSLYFQPLISVSLYSVLNHTGLSG